jgi:hypothetical protein
MALRGHRGLVESQERLALGVSQEKTVRTVREALRGSQDVTVTMV